MAHRSQLETGINFPILAVVIAIVVFAGIVESVVAETRPNVILMMADDLGYSDLSCYGSKTIKTPVLDKLARQGIRLTNFYAGCTICTPSRMALLTGAYPARLGWKGGVVGYGIKPANGLAPEAVTIAEVFKDAGYQTALFGKWHLGDSPELSPMKQGFDSTVYINKSNNQTKKLWRGETLASDPFENNRLTEQFANHAVEFIKENRSRPFFVYLPFSAPHFPAEAHPDWKGKSTSAAYGDVVEELDSRIGDILNALTECRIDERTIVVFLSDNGVEPGQKKWAQAKPFRGLKWSTLEGGNRVPCIIRWPNEIPAGQTSDSIIAAIDLLPTLSAACKIALPKIEARSNTVDGVNVLYALQGVTDRPHPRTSLLFWHGWGTLQAIRMGEWKLYFDSIEELPESKKGPVLIHLADDPAEKKNLSDTYPTRVENMIAEASKQLAEIKQNTIALGGPSDPKQKEPKRAQWLK